MISPVVIRVSTHRRRTGSRNAVVSLELPVIGDQISYPFDGNMHDKVFRDLAGSSPAAESLRGAGELLYRGLTTHPDIKQALTQALSATAAERFPILLELRGDESIEALPWETLYEAQGKVFLGLDARLSVSRRVASKESRPAEGLFPARLQMAAVLSCLGIRADEEWRQLRAAVENSGLAVEMVLFIGEPDLAEAVEAEQVPWVRSIMGIPQSAEELRNAFEQQRRSGFAPQVLHFFTHGSTEGGPHLEVATPTDWEREAPLSSLTLDPWQVRDLSDPDTRPWLIVLNSCLGAAAVTDDRGASTPLEAEALQRQATHSLARRLVQDGGFPAVVGMREPIETSDATLFSSHFYPRLFEALQALPFGTPTALDWSELLVRPRLQLAAEVGSVMATAAGLRKQWTLPVMYLREQELLVNRTRVAAPHAGDGQSGDLEVTETLGLLRMVISRIGAYAPKDYQKALLTEVSSLEDGRR